MNRRTRSLAAMLATVSALSVPAVTAGSAAGGGGILRPPVPAPAAAFVVYGLGLLAIVMQVDRNRDRVRRARHAPFPQVPHVPFLGLYGMGSTVVLFLGVVASSAGALTYYGLHQGWPTAMASLCAFLLSALWMVAPLLIIRFELVAEMALGGAR